MSELPQGWAQRTIEEVADYVSRGRSPKYVAKSDLPVINQKCIRWHGVDEEFVKFIDPETWHQWTEERFAQPNDILWNSTGRGTIGRAALFSGLPSYERAVVDSHVTIVRSGAAIDPSFLFSYVQSPFVQDKIEDMQSGSTNQVELNRTVILATDVPIPPLSEQRRIVAKVDGLTARTARARKELDRIPTLIARYKQRLLALAFSGELTAGWRNVNASSQPVEGRSTKEIRSKFAKKGSDEFNLPFGVPKNWRWLRLPEIGDLDRGKSSHRPRNDSRLFGGEYPFVQTGDVRAADRFLTKFTKTYSDFGLEQSRLWPVGTVCITIAANIAETAILGIEACFPDSVVGFLPDENRISADYVEFFIRTMRTELEAFAPATAQKNINLTVLSNVHVPVPPLEEQVQIVRCISSAFKWLDRVAADHTAATRHLPKLDAAILVKAFSGQLVRQDPNDEPARKLLNRLKAERETAPKKKRNSIKKGKTMAAKKIPLKQRILDDSANWPTSGILYSEIASRIRDPHDVMRDTLFEMLGAPSPALRQHFDIERKEMVIQRVAT